MYIIKPLFVEFQGWWVGYRGQLSQCSCVKERKVLALSQRRHRRSKMQNDLTASEILNKWPSSMTAASGSFRGVKPPFPFCQHPFRGKGGGTHTPFNFKFQFKVTILKISLSLLVAGSRVFEVICPLDLFSHKSFYNCQQHFIAWL